MTKVDRLPGHGCRHHTSGRCLYQEHLNPGYAEGWRCRVLAHWEDEYDEFLVRVDNFGVRQDAVPDLWSRKFERLARETLKCDMFSYAEGADIPACIHNAQGICRLNLPSCDGRCRHYSLEIQEEE